MSREIRDGQRRFSITLLRMGIGDVPGPELNWMRDFGEWKELAFQVALLRNGSITALINTGPPEDLTALNENWCSFLGARAALRRGAGEYVLDQLSGLGITPQEITHIVLTPLQLYSVGNVDRFPHAQINISKRGWVHFHTTHRHPHDDRGTSIPDDILQYLVGEAWPRVNLLNDEDEVVDGIRTWWCGGHHRASMVVEVDSPSGVAAISDSYFHLSNVEDDHPIGISENIYESLAAYERVRRTADIVVPLYDPDNFVRFPNGVVA